MNARKRPAQEPLLPLRSAKVRRTALLHSSGGHASPSPQDIGLGSRWMGLLDSLVHLSCDTVLFIFGKSHPPQLPTTSSPPIPPIPPLRPSSSRDSHTSKRPPRDPSPPPRRSSDHLPIRLPLVPSSSRQPLVSQVGLGHTAQKTGLLSPPTTHSTLSSDASGSFTGSYPELDAAIVKVGRARAGDGRVVKSYRERPHIYDRKHKKETPLYWKKTLEEMKQELFEIHKKRGYRSGYDEFQGWLAYGMQLDGTKDVNDVKAVLSPSTSFSDLRERAKNIEFRARRNTGAEDFLRRALQKARATISSPPAPRFSGYDAIRNAQREQDEAIDKRIRPPFPTSLPPKDDAEVDKYLRQRGATWKCAREQVSDTDLTRLHPSQWLNDEIINFYGAMIMKRATENKENAGKKGKKLLNVHYFSSFFWSKLKTVGYEKGRLAKWTKAFDIFEKDVVLIPVNHNNAHWTAAAINFAKKRIESYDSMGMDRSSVYKLLREYVSAEFRNKKKKEFDWTGWTDYVMEDTPQQENGYDCGVFTCQFLESISRGESSFPFTQQNMPYLRRRMIWEICHSQLREDS